MKYPTLLFCTLWVLLLACHRNHQNALKTQHAATYLFEHSLQDSIVWQLIELYDPYQNGKRIRIDSLNPQYLIIHEDGKFSKLKKGEQVQGRWYMRRDKEAFAFIPAATTPSPQTLQSLNYRYEIRRYEKDTMMLAWQGRHGFVEETYVRIEYPQQTLRK